MQKFFFEIIRVAIGSQQSLSRQLSVDEWDELFEFSKKQSLVGICFVGLQRLGANVEGGYAAIGMAEETFFTWVGMAAQIQVRNELVNAQCRKLQKNLSDNGIRSSILKGQGIASLYGDLSSFRQSGDIDLYVDMECKEAYALACKLNGKEAKFEYKHFPVDVFADTEVELHYIPEGLFCPWRKRRLLKWYDEVKEEMFASDANGITTPSLYFNKVFILLHAYRHLFSGGIGLRQIMDYYFVLKTSSKVQDSKSKEVSEVLDSLGMKRFAAGVMWIMKEAFGLSDDLLFCEANEKEGRFILNEIMAGGNFGHYDERYKKRSGSRVSFLLNLISRNMTLFSHYPIEVMCVPYYYVWHFFWKRLSMK